MLNKDCFIDRDIEILKYCANDGYIDMEDVEKISVNIVLFFEGLLVKVTNRIEGYDNEKALEMMMNYVKSSLHYYTLKAKNLIPPFSEF